MYRSLCLIVIGVSASAAASPPPVDTYDSTFFFARLAVGPQPALGGDLRRASCDGSCPALRFSFGGGGGRWSGGIRGATLRLSDGIHEIDTTMWGLHARVSLVRRWGFDLSVRAGFEIGNADADASDSPVRGPDRVLGLDAGLTLAWRVLYDRVFFGLEADVGASALDVMYTDRSAWGRAATITVGGLVGVMFDIL